MLWMLGHEDMKWHSISNRTTANSIQYSTDLIKNLISLLNIIQFVSAQWNKVIVNMWENETLDQVLGHQSCNVTLWTAVSFPFRRLFSPKMCSINLIEIFYSTTIIFVRLLGYKIHIPNTKCEIYGLSAEKSILYNDIDYSEEGVETGKKGWF